MVLQEKTPRKHGALLGLSKTFFELGDYYRSLIIILRNYERYLEGPARTSLRTSGSFAYPQGYWESILTYSKNTASTPILSRPSYGKRASFMPRPCPRQAPGGDAGDAVYGRMGGPGHQDAGV